MPVQTCSSLAVNYAALMLALTSGGNDTLCFIAPCVRLGHYQLGTLERVLPVEDDRLFDEIVEAELIRCGVE